MHLSETLSLVPNREISLPLMVCFPLNYFSYCYLKYGALSVVRACVHNVRFKTLRNPNDISRIYKLRVYECVRYRFVTKRT